MHRPARGGGRGARLEPGRAARAAAARRALRRLQPVPARAAERGQARALACALADRDCARPPRAALTGCPRPRRRRRPERARRRWACAPLGGLAAPVSALERLDEPLRAAPTAQAGGRCLDAGAPRSWAGREAEAAQILRGLGFARARNKAAPDAPAAWRPPRLRRPASSRPPAKPHSPFAALAALKPAPARNARRRVAPTRARLMSEETPAGSTSGCGARAFSSPARWPPEFVENGRGAADARHGARQRLDKRVAPGAGRRRAGLRDRAAGWSRSGSRSSASGAGRRRKRVASTRPLEPSGVSPG